MTGETSSTCYTPPEITTLKQLIDLFEQFLTNDTDEPATNDSGTIESLKSRLNFEPYATTAALTTALASIDAPQLVADQEAQAIYAVVSDGSSNILIEITSAAALEGAFDTRLTELEARGSPVYATTGGTVDEITLATPTGAGTITEEDGLSLLFIPPGANTIAPTVALNGGTARDIVSDAAGTALTSGALGTSPVIIVYDATNTRWQLLAGGSGSASDDEIKTLTVANSALTVRVSENERQLRVLSGNVVYLLGHDGQSLGAPRGNSKVSLSAPTRARMFNAGIWPHFINTPSGFDSVLASDTATNAAHNIYVERIASLVQLAEYDDDGGKESPWTGCASWIENVDTMTWYAGQGSQRVARLGGEGIHLTSETQMLESFARLVRAEGKEPVWPFSGFPQGHADAIAGTEPEVWKAAVLDLQQRRTDLASATWGYDVPLVPHITEVMNNSGYALTNNDFTDAEAYANTRAIMIAQSVIAEENALIYCAGPTYQWVTLDGVHTDGRETRLRGEMDGKVGASIMSGAGWTHCYITSASVSGSDITVSIRVPVGSLALDTTLVDDPGDSGFEVLDNGGTALAISSVTVGTTAGGMCDVIVSVASGTPSTLRYALQEFGYKGGPGNGNAASDGARGNLRDSDPAVAKYDGTPLYNWLCPKEIAL